MILNERRPLPQDGRYCAYLRKSREEDKYESAHGGDVLAKHRMLLDYASDMNGHDISHTYKEVRSGETIAAREQVRALIDAVQAGEWDGVYVMAVDRLSRGSQQDQGIICDLLEITGLFIVTPSGYFDPWNTCDMDTIRYQLFASNTEFRSYSRRMQDSIKVSVMGGQYIGRYVPWGYEKIKLDTGFKTLKPTADAFYVKMMFCWAGYENRSLYWIAKELTSMGVKPPRGPEGKEWNPSTVSGILSNEVYMGVSKWGKFKTTRTFSTDALNRPKKLKKTDKFASGKGQWEPIVDKELFELVKLQRSRRNTTPTKHEVTNVCANLLYCSKCGRTMKVVRDSYSGKLRVLHKPGFHCTQKGAEQKVVIEKLVEALNETLEDIEIELGGEKARADHENQAKTIASVEQRLAKLEDMTDELITARLSKELTPAEFAKAKGKLDSEKKVLEAKLKEAQENLSKTRDMEKLRTTVKNACMLLLDDNVTNAEKNTFLRTFIKTIDYTNESDYGKNDKLELTVTFI